MSQTLPIVVGITGGSGAWYARRLVQVLCQQKIPTHVVISCAGRQVIKQELDLELDPNAPDLESLFDLQPSQCSSLQFHGENDYFTPIASGSFVTGGMVICPCSGSTLSAVANGSSRNLVQRAAEVHLKERRRLILVPRETPVSRVALKNMLEAHDAGATILPASPGWYHGVDSLSDLVDFIVARILDQLQVDNQLVHRWGQK